MLVLFVGITFIDTINRYKTKEMEVNSQYRIKSFSKATLYIILYAIMMIILLKLITSSKAMNNISMENDKKAEYYLIDERKIMP